jgi:hypothetical protein
MLSSDRGYIENLGLVSVIILSSKQSEVRGKLNVVEEIACFRNDKPFIMTVRSIKNSKYGFRYKIESSKEITEEEYENILKTSLE